MASTTSAISFGRLDSSGGRPRLVGSSSGLDIDSLVKSLAEAKRIPAVRLERRIETNDARIEALKEIRSALAGLRDAVAGLRSPPGLSGASSNLFEAKQAFFSSSTTTPPNTILGVTASAGAAVGSYSVVVERLATAAKLASGATADPNAALATSRNGGTPFSGSFTLGLADGPAATITVEGADSLVDLRAKINAVTETTGVSASVLRVSATESRLVLTATETGRAIRMAGVAGDDVLAITGLSTDGGATAAQPLQLPATSRVLIDGVAVERTGNRLSDVINGLTIDLFKAEAGTTVTLDIERSLDGVRNGIGSFVEAYNKVRDLIARQQVVSATGEVSPDAVLFGSSLLRGINAELGASIGSAVAGRPAGLPRTLGELGLVLDANNRLSIDEAKLNARLQSGVDALRGVFEFQATVSSADLRILGRGSQMPSSTFQIQITDANADGIIEAATIDGVAARIEGGRRIQGAAGTAWEGWSFAWSGTGSTNVDVAATRGIAERLHHFLDQVTDAAAGRIEREIGQIEDRSKSMREEIGRIDLRVEDYRARIVERFNTMETALSLANALLQQVKAQTAAWSGRDS